MLNQVKMIMALRILLAVIGLATDYILYLYYGEEIKGAFNYSVYIAAVASSILSMGIEYKMHNENNHLSINPYNSLVQLTILIIIFVFAIVMLNITYMIDLQIDHFKYLTAIIILEMYNTQFMHIFLRQKNNTSLFVIRFNRRILFLIYIIIASIFFKIDLDHVLQSYMFISFVTLILYMYSVFRFGGFKLQESLNISSLISFISVKSFILKLAEIMATRCLFLLLFLRYDDLDRGYLGSLVLLHESQMMISQSFFMSKISTNNMESDITLKQIFIHNKKLLFFILLVFFLSPVLFSVIYVPTNSFSLFSGALITIYSLIFSVLITMASSLFSKGRLSSSSVLFFLSAICNILAFVTFDNFSHVILASIFQHLVIIAIIRIYNNGMVGKV
ncbi:hypothetical protein N8Z41_02770 [Amylibacter sp.]|nr:hypothetical protein [Amylibacter sp.]